ncbi:putative Proteasome subunit alpha type-2-B [Paratrimastix pyriformis]|uniref:Proteasome subunit alpha type n=1 Tax=Paratrimastix pyriformis TaxID=342808 RepID=A0ABQ8UUW4_9EUKA|nr:putative Proteasome subunit alpha type-2-B [Paratrimastix pyriformis]
MAEHEYSFSLTTFSPTGKLVQIEHALAAVGSGGTSLGIKARNGVVLVTEKKMPSILVDETSIQKVQLLSDNIGCVYSGVGPDARVLVRKGRKEAEVYGTTFGEPMPTGQQARYLASVMQEFTQSGGVRPFGVSLLVAGFDPAGEPQLFQVDPSGSYWRWKAAAIGKGMVNCKTFLEKRFNPDMDIEDAIHIAILTLKEVFDGEMTKSNIEVGVIREDRVFRNLTPDEIQDYLQEGDI